MMKLNNRGFAFSTILYGLLIMGIMIVLLIMSTMQTNRQNNKYFINKIEDELNRYSLTQTEFRALNGGDAAQEYIVPDGQSGWYKIELWGSQGGGAFGGNGAYTSGMIWLNEKRKLYFYIGKSNGTNGGGSAKTSLYSGGGSTDVRLSTSLESRIMVASGGGGQGNDSNGGAGGTILGYGSNTNNGALQTGTTFGVGASTNTANTGGGGSGYYGGGSGSTNFGGGGGSSYISGYAGVSSKGRTTNNNLATLTSYTESGLNLYFINGLMIPGVRVGDGAAKITKISSNDINNPPNVLNNNIYSQTGYRYVRDCTTGSSLSDNKNTWKEIQVIKDGKNIAVGSSKARVNTGSGVSGTVVNQSTNGTIAYNTDTYTGSTTLQCLVVNLGSQVTNISEIAVWHNFDNLERAVKNHYVQVSTNGSSWINIASSSDKYTLESNETYNGFHYTAWQPDSTKKLEDGTYYIQWANSDNKFVTKDLNSENGDVMYKLFTGDSTQKWTVKSLSNGYYKITNVADGTTLQIANGTEYDNVSINSTVFVDGYDDNGIYIDGYNWEKWKITPVGSGSYSIISGFDTFLGVADDVNDTVIKARNEVKASENSLKNRTQRFKFISANY